MDNLPRNTLYENRESSYLRAYKAPVLCPLSFVNGPSTSVENPLQIDLFMQNKPNVKNAQINVSSFITSKYVKVDTW
jgi:hypothetical protein